MVSFLKTMPAFKNLTFGKVLSYFWQMEKREYIKGQCVYEEKQSANHVYITLEGSFEMTKKLPREDTRKQAYLQVPKGEKKAKVSNVLTSKFPHMKDFPLT